MSVALMVVYDFGDDEPLLRHDQLLSKLFSHNAWSKKARSGQLSRHGCINYPSAFDENKMTPERRALLGSVSPGRPLWVMCGRRLGKNFLSLLQHWSGAVMCPACLCGRCGRWP